MPQHGDDVVYFWFPLQQRLTGIEDPVNADLEESVWPSGLAKVADPALPPSTGDVSLYFAYAPDLSSSDRGLSGCLRYARQSRESLLGASSPPCALKQLPKKLLARARSSGEGLSIVESAVTLPDGWDDDPAAVGAHLTSALDASLLAAKLTLLQVHQAQPTVPRVVPSPELLPAHVPYAIFKRTSDKTMESVGGLSLLINDLGSGAAALHQGAPNALGLTPYRAPFITYWSLHNDASVLLHLQGHYRPALILIAAAAENMVDEIAQLLMWTDGMTAAAAGAEFSKPVGVLSRAASLLGPRIGGNWHKGGATAPKAWHTDIVTPRNASIHAGADVTRQMAHQAWTTLDELRLYVGGRVMRNQSKYPVPALAVSVGLNLSSSKSKHAPKAATLVEKSPPPPGKQITDFEVWQQDLRNYVASVKP